MHITATGKDVNILVTDKDGNVVASYAATEFSYEFNATHFLKEVANFVALTQAVANQATNPPKAPEL